MDRTPPPIDSIALKHGTIFMDVAAVAKHFPNETAEMLLNVVPKSFLTIFRFGTRNIDVPETHFTLITDDNAHSPAHTFVRQRLSDYTDGMGTGTVMERNDGGIIVGTINDGDSYVIIGVRAGTRGDMIWIATNDAKKDNRWFVIPS